jgi:anti-sigma regulatory factor (Ser/Thr protein kinase)
MASLEIEITQNIREVVEIEGSITLGRKNSNDIILLHKGVSRCHAKIYQDENDYILEDLQSANGVFVNGQKIHFWVLCQGDIIEIGNAKLNFTFQTVGMPDLEIDLTKQLLEDYDQQQIMDAQHIVLHFYSQSQVIDQVNEFFLEKLEHFTDLSEKDKACLGTATQEAIGNAQRHGHKYRDDLKVELRFIKKQELCTVRVTDQGSGFNHIAQLEQSESLTPVEAARQRYLEGGYGGLGIMLMKGCIDRIEYNHKGNQITLSRFLRRDDALT